MPKTLTRLFACISLLLSATCAAAQPRLELSEYKWDYGSVWYGEPLEWEVLLMNMGDEPLRITAVLPSCICTSARLSKAVIQPGGSAPMKVAYDTTARMRKDATRVTIESNDPQQPKVVFHVTGKVMQYFDLDPSGGASFGQLARGDSKTQTVEIKNNYPKQVKLELVPTEHEAFDVALEELEPGKRFRLVAKTKPPLLSGNHRLEAIVKTNLKRMPEIKVPIRAYVVPRVSVSPTLLYHPKVIRKRRLKTLKVRSPAANPVTVTEVTSDHAGVTAEILPLGEPDEQGFRTQKIRVSLPPGPEIPDEGAVVKLRTDANDPEFDELTVNIVTIRPRGQVKPRNKPGKKNPPAKAP